MPSTSDYLTLANNFYSMPAKAIFFYSEDINFTLSKKTVVRNWLTETIRAEGYELELLNFIFCSDAYLLRLNQQYLDHDTYTDVITFDNSERLKTIVGDIFISIERVRENASGLGISANTELMRVMIHGTLHLLDYKDKSKADKQKMTAREDYYLEKLA